MSFLRKFTILFVATLMLAPTVASAKPKSIDYNRSYWITLYNNTDYSVTISDIENDARYGTVIDDDTVTDRIEGTIEPGKSQRGRIRLLDKTQYTEILFKASFTKFEEKLGKDDTKTCHYWISIKTEDGSLAGISATRSDGNYLPACSYTSDGNDRYSFYIAESKDVPSAD